MNGGVSPMHEQEDPRSIFVFHPPPRPYWLHILLLLLTILSTLIVGAKLQDDFNRIGDTYFMGDNGFFPLQWLWTDPKRLLLGIPFSATLLGILFAHEMGHFIWSVRHGVYATLPYFLPLTSPIRTFGAFIKIKSPFRSRAALLDIGIAGPIAGFVVAAPATAVGLALSQHAAPGPDVPQVGMPLIFNLLHGALETLNIGAA